MIDVRIGRVVLEGLGLELGQADRLREALERELGGLLEREGLPATLQSGAASAVAGPAIQLPARSSALGLARAIAGGVHSAVSTGL